MDFDPVLVELPEQIETERLLVRTPRLGDWVEVNEAIRESAAALAPWMPWATPVPSVRDTEINLRRAIAKVMLREDIRLQLHSKNDGRFIGASGLHRINWKIPKFEIGYWIRTSCCGMGYMTEAVRAISSLALDQLKAARVEIICNDLNERSWRVAERCGFKLEGVLRQHERDHFGKLRDTRFYSRIPGDM